MRHYEFATTLVEAVDPLAAPVVAPQPTTTPVVKAKPVAKTVTKPEAKPVVKALVKPTKGVDPTEIKAVTKPEVEAVLRAGGYEDFKINGNKINVIVQIPDGAKKNEYRVAIMKEVIALLKAEFDEAVQYVNDPGLSSLGGAVFDNSTVCVVIKDAGKQAEKSAGMSNELELASTIQSVIEKYGMANVTFKDKRGKKMTIKNATEAEMTGKETSGGRKADIVLRSARGVLPISIKELSADFWESSDTAFGARAKEILQKLQDEGIVKLTQIAERTNKRTGEKTPVWKLNKEIVMEPTTQEAMNAIFGSDLNPRGGIVIQDFGPEHFTQKGNNIEVACHAVITNKDEIPESHLMVWQIRNDSTRMNPLPGLRTLAATLTRGIGKKGTKDVILVDQYGNVVKNPNITS